MRTTTTGTFITATAIAAALALAGCTSTPEDVQPSAPGGSFAPAPANPGDADDGSAEASPTEKLESEAELKKIEKQMEANDLDKAQLKAVRAYLEVRENAESDKYDGRKAWEDALKDVTTSAGFKTTAPDYGPAESSNAQMVAEKNGYHVKVAIGACALTPGYGESEDKSVAAQCDLTDLVISDDGSLVTSQTVENTWPYYGPQDPPNMILAKDGDKWLMDGDFTGKAS